MIDPLAIYLITLIIETEEQRGSSSTLSLQPNPISLYGLVQEAGADRRIVHEIPPRGRVPNEKLPAPISKTAVGPLVAPNAVLLDCETDPSGQESKVLVPCEGSKTRVRLKGNPPRSGPPPKTFAAPGGVLSGLPLVPD